MCELPDDHNKLLSLPNGRSVEDLGTLLKQLETGYNVKVATATTLQKEVATKAAMKCSPGEVALLSKQMSHSVATHRKHYEELGTSSHAVNVTKKLAAEPVQHCTKFTREEERNIREYFRDNIISARVRG